MRVQSALSAKKTGSRPSESKTMFLMTSIAGVCEASVMVGAAQDRLTSKQSLL